ncbi:MAG TPA: helix-turn-helix domain-containing protein [Steroidobacteraceae bacterium]|nr:helix-turn-helix domain-containing protein [Steroidobacteraceae bacterium]
MDAAPSTTGSGSKACTRAEAQRSRILRAAEQCFVEKGFHAASMAAIAQTAEMSPGLIYRYFKSKNEIILAIIDHQLGLARARIGELHGAADLAAGITRAFQKAGEGDKKSISAPLFLEMSAEATRDPQIAAAIREFDSTVRADIAHVLARSPKQGGYGLEAGSAAAGRALLLICLLDGLKVREAREPHLDRKLLHAALTELLNELLTP